MTRQSRMRPSKERLQFELRAELRSILRQIDELRRPISHFVRYPDPDVGQPPFCVVFDVGPHRRISGHRIKVRTLGLPDERILDAAFALAKSIWHLKDRLHQWVRANNLQEDVDAYAKACPALLISADLANWKKHGRSQNVSGRKPRLEMVELDTSQSGVIEFFYDGAMKEKELLVTNPAPIPLTVPVFIGMGVNSGWGGWGSTLDS